jgi:hypothetical protein
MWASLTAAAELRMEDGKQVSYNTITHSQPQQHSLGVMIAFK